MKYKPTIGLEIHAELKTRTKMFCDSLNDPDEKHPNTNICPVCMGFPGTLPVINEEAVKKTILVGFALNCEIARQTSFDRKNYFYPDLPKGYQISQYKRPLCSDGSLGISGKKVRITRVHLEEDAGRLQHDERGDHSLVDFNRAGVPLMELVTEPDITSAEEVREFAEKLRLMLRYLGVSDANMEKGQMRVEVNISISSTEKNGVKVEIKNLNSIRAAVQSVDYEIKRQSELLDEGKEVKQETRGWDEAGQKTFSQRSKEEAHDYRYFPEPDLPVLNFDEKYLEDIKYLMPELPEQRKMRFNKDYGLNDAQIDIFTIAKHLGDYYERVASELGVPVPKLPVVETKFRNLYALSANYIITEFPPLMQAKGMEIDDIEGFKISPEAFAELMVLIFHQKLSSTGAKVVLKEMAETGLHPEQIMKEKNLGQVSDIGELQKAVEEVISKNPKAVEDYKKGKKESLKFLVGQVMAATKGKANPKVAQDLLEKTLG
ncbi:MAG: glutaminyl-tRNA synthase (glutamine-hydrolyzing) subunit B [Parcubacteria group bacterium RIFCSPHIGHO2_01_FULL_45_26]|nr:MAG: glutaminyl-tRNA synthase (glutamine-hydrolyzing) subunit B [Parcubacteria group bacterium RIFCSPHIGHO2_01_FULL_45_26]